MIQESLAVLVNTAKLKNLIESGNMCRILGEVSYSELEAGKYALGQIDMSQNPRDAINRALGHFESAFKVAEQIPTPIFNMNKATKKCTLGFVALCASAICHKYLGDSSKIINDELVIAYEEINDYINTLSYNNNINSEKDLINRCKEMAGKEFGNLIGNLKAGDPGYEFFKFANNLTNDKLLIERLENKGKEISKRWEDDEELEDVYNNFWLHM